MKVIDWWKKFWKFLKKDTWQSWVVSLILAFIIIKFIFFPGLSFVMGTSLPLVVVESCSMYHEASFDKWWESNAAWYEKKGITKEDFKEFKIPKGIYLTSLNYDTGLKSSLGNKNTIIEALKYKDINNIDNNKLISVNSYDKLIKYRQFY